MIKPVYVIYLALMTVLAPFTSKGQIAPRNVSKRVPAPSIPAKTGDVVILALAALGDSMEVHRGHVRETLTGNTKGDLESDLLEIQMRIVAETAPFGPVILVAPDDQTRSSIQQRCDDFEICDYLESGSVRIQVVKHEGVWIRDFGPQVEQVSGKVRVVHWRYHDSRVDESLAELKKSINLKRIELLEQKLKAPSDRAVIDELEDEDSQGVNEKLDKDIASLRDFSEILSDPSFADRDVDDRSAFDIADAVLGNPNFERIKSAMSVDGGNLLKLDDGRCLTTKILLARNRDFDVSKDLMEKGGCRDVIFLEPLPGPVIEHVDMFALPVNSHTILLASYDLSQTSLKDEWLKLKPLARDLTFEAGLAMRRNENKLRALGYEIVEVPSPLPRVSRNSDTYYPTVLNALVRTNATGGRQVLVPYYEDYENGIQDAALEKIRSAFGPQVSVVPIESTGAAKAQGAVHCLTLTMPLDASVFTLSGEAEERRNAESLRRLLKQSLAEAKAPDFSSDDIIGAWKLSDAPDDGDDVGVAEESDDETALPTIEFEDDSKFSISLGEDGPETGGTFKLLKSEEGDWKIDLLFSDTHAWHATLKPLAPNRLRLNIEDKGSFQLRREE